MRTAVARFLQFLTVERNASAYTVKSYREDLRTLTEYLAEAHGGESPSAGNITVFDLRGYVAALSEAGYAKTTIARHLASMRSFFRFGLREGWVKTNPAKPLRSPRKGRSLPHFLSAEELGRLFDAPPPNHPMGLRDRAILETMYSAGLRVSEAAALKVRDIDSDRMTIRVDEGKGSKDRYTVLAKRTLHFLRGYWRMYQPSHWLFEGQKPASHLNVSSLQRVFIAAKQKAQIAKPVTIHSLRHSFATHMLEQGTDIHIVQRLLGHANINTTTIYVHLKKKSVAAVVSPLDHPSDETER